MKTMTNEATLIKKGAAEFHKLLPRCKDHPALVGDAAKADALLLTLLALLLLLLELELVEPVVVVPVGGTTVGVSTAAELSVDVGATELDVERIVRGSVAPSMEFEEDADDDEALETGKVIGVMANNSLESPESPYTKTQIRI